jgi:hypothetical protein
MNKSTEMCYRRRPGASFVTAAEVLVFYIFPTEDAPQNTGAMMR